MDVVSRRREINNKLKSFIICVGFLFQGCAEKKAATVFPEGDNNSLQCSSQSISGEYIVTWESGLITKENFPNDDYVKENFLAERISEVRFVEKNKLLHRIEANNIKAGAPISDTWGLDSISARSVWGEGFRGQGVTIAVTDLRVDHTHQQLEGIFEKNNSEINGSVGVDDDNNGLVDDFFGWDFELGQTATATKIGEDHGTHVTGILAAQPADNGMGMVGVAPNAKILSFNMFDSRGAGNLAWALEAIRQADRRGAKIINASWGGEGCSETLKNQISIMKDRLLFVAAAGNDGYDLDQKSIFPASLQLPNSLTVGAVREDGIMAAFSNSSFNFVHLVAPGDKILSTIPGGTATFSGTSMSTPYVSGVAALLWSARPEATPQQIRAAILAGVDRGRYRVQTQGRLNAAKALAELRRMMP